MTSLEHFFDYNDICDYDEIMYITKTKGTRISNFYLTDGRVLTKYINLKTCEEELPSNIFIHLNKGIVVNKHHIKCINRYIYHMDDGAIFEGILKDIKFHKSLKEQVRRARQK